jgi:hypothetical protein
MKSKRIMLFYDSVKPVLETMRYGCLAIIEKADLLLYKPGTTKPDNMSSPVTFGNTSQPEFCLV